MSSGEEREREILDEAERIARAAGRTRSAIALGCAIVSLMPRARRPGPSNVNGYLGLFIGILTQLRERPGARKREADFIGAMKTFLRIHGEDWRAPARGAQS